MKDKVSICWLRRDLRLSDNIALSNALQGKYPVVLVFIFDAIILEKISEKKDRRVNFIYRTLAEINDTLLKKKSSIYTLQGTPVACFKALHEQFEIKAVFANHDYEPYAIERDDIIERLLAEYNIPFFTYKDQVIFEKYEIMKADGLPYTVFTPYSKVWKQKYRAIHSVSLPSDKPFDNLLKGEPYRFPSLKELGFEPIDEDYYLPRHIDDDIILKYNDTRNIPSIDGTSRLGIHIRFGTISIRHLVSVASRLNTHWLDELIWREFFMMILYHFPYVVNRCFKRKYDNIQWRNNEQEFELWCKGETGYPIVDAGMRQLNETGWMHNRVRMITASFLIKHLLIDWRWGEAYFAEKLLDYDLASNNGNWQWAAGCGCDAAPYFRIFNPYEQTKRFDPELKYIKRWVKDYPDNYPDPIVNHEFARKRALEVYKRSLSVP